MSSFVVSNSANLTSPKRSFSNEPKFDYGYYAGYTTTFVHSVIETLSLDHGATILDPWNGSGTTTFVAQQQRFASIGNDLNPAMAIIARARCAAPLSKNRLIEEARCLLNCKDVQAPYLDLDWLPQELQSPVSSILSYCNVCTDGLHYDALTDEESVLLTALFRSTRTILASAFGSNPTWIKIDQARGLQVSAANFEHLFLKTIEELTANSQSNPSEALPLFQIGSATSLALKSESINAVVTSPPYLTRIDYVKATLIELLLLQQGSYSQRALRKTMTGSVLGGSTPELDEAWGDEALASIVHAETVARQLQRSDGKYYSGTFRRYFRDMYASLNELDRVLTCKGRVVLVVQGSHHRGRYVDLPLVMAQMAESLGWSLDHISLWQGPNFGRINPRSKNYQHRQVEEAVIFLTKQCHTKN